MKPVPYPRVLRLFGRPEVGGEAGYMLTEVLVYIGLVFLLLGIAYGIMYRMVDQSVLMRRNAEDIVRALDAGERWRKDVRSATRVPAWENQNGERVFLLPGTESVVEYRFSDGALYRRTGDGVWSRVLDRIESSLMKQEVRTGVSVWRWDVELQPRAKGSLKPGRVKPLFTFLAVPPVPVAP